jgi:hypothetical protein
MEKKKRLFDEKIQNKAIYKSNLSKNTCMSSQLQRNKLAHLNATDEELYFLLTNS